MRFGTRTELKRKWTPQGHRPKAPVKIGYEFAYLYLALCPFSGKVFAMFLPYMNKECFRLFSQQFAQDLSDPTLLIVDRASTHQSNLLAGSSIVLHHLPAACPELNPVERVFKEIRRKLANRVFHSLQQAEHLLTKLVEELIHQPATIISLTSYEYITSYLN
jgi:transposase